MSEICFSRPFGCDSISATSPCLRRSGIACSLSAGSSCRIALVLPAGDAGDGAPELVGLVGKSPNLSISHGKREAIAVAGWVAKLGVDLCDHTDAGRVSRVAGRFITAPECELARAVGDPVGWATLWALK